MINKKSKKETRKVRHLRVRKKISGTPECPRLCVYKSNTGVYAQIIDDVNGKTLVTASTLDKEVKTKKSNKEAAKEVAENTQTSKVKLKKGKLGDVIIHNVLGTQADVVITGNPVIHNL